MHLDERKMKILKLAPGVLLSVAIAAVACLIEELLPIHVIGSAVIAMFIGMILNYFLRNTKIFARFILCVWALHL